MQYLGSRNGSHQVYLQHWPILFPQTRQHGCCQLERAAILQCRKGKYEFSPRNVNICVVQIAAGPICMPWLPFQSLLQPSLRTIYSSSSSSYLDSLKAPLDTNNLLPLFYATVLKALEPLTPTCMSLHLRPLLDFELLGQTLHVTHNRNSSNKNSNNNDHHHHDDEDDAGSGPWR